MMTEVENETAGAVATEVVETEKDLFSIAKEWDSAGRPYTAKEIALFESFSFEVDSMDMFLKDAREIGDPIINNFVLLSVMHSGSKKTKEICETLYRSKKYQMKYLEILFWLLELTTGTTIKSAKMQMKIWFAIEICSAESLINYIRKGNPPEYVRKKIVRYSLPGQTWQMAEDVCNNNFNDNPYRKALFEVMKEFSYNC